MVGMYFSLSSFDGHQKSNNNAFVFVDNSQSTISIIAK